MQTYSIALSGLSAAQKGLDIVGNNVANAATEGYHRQRIEFTPAYSSQVGAVLFGGGVDIAGIGRSIDELLEREILKQQSLLEQASQELSTLQGVENTFGELATKSGLSAAIDEFFNALRDLSAHPNDIIWQNQAVTVAQTMAGQFRALGQFLSNLETQITLEAESTIERVNALIGQIAELNDNVERMEIKGTQANNLRDQRDQRISELGELVGLETQNRAYGAVDVNVAGIAVVSEAATTELEVGLASDNRLGICPAGVGNYSSDLQGGRLGGLMSLRNELLSGIRNDLDALAQVIIQRVNQYHAQGVGSAGSFTELTGWYMTSENLADFDPPVADGNIYIRVTNTTTGEISRHAIVVDASSDSLSSIASDIAAISGLMASVASSRLHIQAETGYEFDFLPAVLPEPTASNLTGASPPAVSVSGIYTGAENDTFTFTVSGSGSVGNGSLQLEVRNGAGEVITTLNVGSGYAAGDRLEMGNGIGISLTTGDLNAGDSFEVDAFASTDTSGVLAAVGINVFFCGTDAASIAICPEVVNSPGRIATALGSDTTDNANVSRMAGLRDQAIETLGSMTPGQFYRRLVTDIGQEVASKRMRQDNIAVLVQNLSNRQSEISGVNINDEAAQLLVFEQMFQAMAKYLAAVQTSITTIMEIM